MHLIQTMGAHVQHVFSLFSVVHCTVQNLLTFLGKEGDGDLGRLHLCVAWIGFCCIR